VTPTEIKREARRLTLSRATLATFTPAERQMIIRAADAATGCPVLLTFIDLNRFAAKQRKPFDERVAALDHARKLKCAAVGGLPHAVLSLELSAFPVTGEQRARKARAALAARVRKLTSSDRATLLHLHAVLGDLR
jgi:hypothetical protein